MTDLPFWLAAILAGFFGSTHCVGMCGGIAGVLTHAVRTPQAASPHWLQSGFHAGRITSYCLLALFLGGIAQSLLSMTSLQWWADVLRVVAAIMLVMMGLYLTRWWTGLTVLERWGAKIWKYIQPTFLRSSSSVRQSFFSAVLSGMMWGLLPCGLVYSALITASLQANALQAMTFMLLFGLGTVPALLVSAQLMNQASQASLSRWRTVGGVIMIGFGLYVLFTLTPGLLPGQSTNNQHEHHHHLPST